MRTIEYFLICFSLLGMLLVQACSPRTQVTASWSNPEVEKRHYNNVLVAVMVENVNVKRDMESTLVKTMVGKGIHASASHEIFPPKFREGQIDRDEIMEFISENGYDAILTVALIDIETETRYVPGRATYAPLRYYPYYGRFYGYYSHWFPRIYEPGYYTEDKTYFYETNLYDAETENLVWSAQSESIIPARAESFSRDFSSAIVEELTGDHLVASSGD